MRRTIRVINEGRRKKIVVTLKDMFYTSFGKGLYSISGRCEPASGLSTSRTCWAFLAWALAPIRGAAVVRCLRLTIACLSACWITPELAVQGVSGTDARRSRPREEP